MSALIELDHVGFSYGETPILSDITVTIEKGEYIGIIGPNGGGKTTLLKIILGLLKATNGHVRQHAKHIGYVPQRILQERYFPATVAEIIESGAGKKPNPRLGDFLKSFDVERLKEKLISELSGGERQRAFIVRALAGNPQILILDEPYAGIDAAAQEYFYDFIETLHREHGITILMVSHDLDVVARKATRCLCINRTLLCHGIPREILTDKALEKIYGQKLTYLPHEH